jgi:hypothetical protein
MRRVLMYFVACSFIFCIFIYILSLAGTEQYYYSTMVLLPPFGSLVIA